MALMPSATHLALLLIKNITHEKSNEIHQVQRIGVGKKKYPTHTMAIHINAC